MEYLTIQSSAKPTRRVLSFIKGAYKCTYVSNSNNSNKVQLLKISCILLKDPKCKAILAGKVTLHDLTRHNMYDVTSG